MAKTSRFPTAFAILVCPIAGLVFTVWKLTISDGILVPIFTSFFVLRLSRLLTQAYGYMAYRPAPTQKLPRFTYRDVTVVIPTVDPRRDNFGKCVATILTNRPARIVVVTVGKHIPAANAVLRGLTIPRSVDVSCVESPTKGKRRQVAHVIQSGIRTPITVFVDDSVVWGRKILTDLLAPFEISEVGLVGSSKHVFPCDKPLRTHFSERLARFLGATYLERHNFELMASMTLDGGVFVISGRTCAIRTSILQHKDFLPGYINERAFFGVIPTNAPTLEPGDDNYVTRFCLKHGWKSFFQATDDAIISTTIGDRGWKNEFGRLVRWARTTVVSNTATLLTDRTVYWEHPWSAINVFFWALINYNLLWDWGSFFVLLYTRYEDESILRIVFTYWQVILGTKLMKLIPYFYANPRDLPLFPFYVCFAWLHSFVKLYALLTVWSGAWSGREGCELSLERCVSE